jgi:DNA invertase Pin-like site-specific DNA recombinase
MLAQGGKASSYQRGDARLSAAERHVTALDQSKVAVAQRMHASGESASTIATTLGVSRATVYRVLAEED